MLKDSLNNLYKTGVFNDDKIIGFYIAGKITKADLESIVTLNFTGLKKLKTAELDTACNTEITGGFYSNVKGSSRLYGFDRDDQINIEALKNNILQGFIPEGSLEYYAKSQVCEAWTNTEFLTLYQQGMAFKTERIRTCKAKKLAVSTCTTEEELELITWEIVTQA